MQDYSERTKLATDEGFDPGYDWQSKGEDATAECWRKAFVAYLEGMPLKVIAETFNLNFRTLRTKSSREDWPEAKDKLILARTDHRVDVVKTVERQLERIRENRERNLSAAVELRDVLMDIVTRLKAGTLRVEKTFFHAKTGQIVTAEQNPTTGDLVNIATFARTIADLTYRALGDAPADSKQNPNAQATTQAAPPGITVYLPQVAVDPRPRRQRQQDSVVDVQTISRPQAEEPAPNPEKPVAKSPQNEGIDGPSDATT